MLKGMPFERWEGFMQRIEGKEIGFKEGLAAGKEEGFKACFKAGQSEADD